MIRLLRVELLKIRTARTPFALLATAAGLTAGMASLDAARAGGKFTPPLTSSAGLSFIVTITGFAQLMALIAGILISSGEFRHGTATLTYLAAPRRGRVLVAKLLAGFSSGLVFGALGTVTADAVGLAFAAAKGDGIIVAAGTLARFGLGATLAGGLLAALGVAVGSLVRSQLPAVVGALVWSLLLESVLSGVFGSAGPYLPFTAASTLAGSRLGGGDVGFYSSSSGQPLPFAVAAALVAGLAIVISVMASVTSIRADIS
jgi:ABC-type transport system involved in multi-copper enzyme maturation permease subunit